MSYTDNMENLIRNFCVTQNSAVKTTAELDERIVNDVLEAYERSKKAKPPVNQANIWRIIMNSRITKPAAAAVIIIGAVSLFSWFGGQQDPSRAAKPVTCFSLLSQACAAERALFISEDIVHIVNEITVYPAAKDVCAPDRLDQFSLTAQQRDYLKTVSSWLDYNWLPICSLQADGQFRFNQLKLSTDIDQPYAIADQAWYDPATGRFARVMKTAEKVIFANSYDGKSVYWSETTPDGSLQLMEKPITAHFTAPQNPAEFLGITAGLRSSVREDDFGPVQEITEGALDDGSVVRIYKVGFADLLGDVNTYWLFKVRNDDSTIAEMEFVLTGQTRMVIRRVTSESVDTPQISWNLAQLEQTIGVPSDNVAASVAGEMFIPDISVKQMVERADFETYIFATVPAWTSPPEIADIVDFTNPQHRMFTIIYRAGDGRHLILCQGKTFNSFFANLLKGSGQPLYVSSNGCKLWGGGPEKWWTEIHLRNCGFTPAEDRRGYVMESPDGTFASLAVNGQLTDEELVRLVDSLVPAKMVLQLNKAELEDYVRNLPRGKMDRTSDPLRNPNNGMPAEGLTTEQCMVKIAKEYWNAIIKEDWDHVAKLRPLYSAEFWKNKYSKAAIVELIEVRRPYKPDLPCSGLVVPCILKLENGTVIERKVVVMYRIINGKSSCVIPALWGKKRVIK